MKKKKLFFVLFTVTLSSFLGGCGMFGSSSSEDAEVDPLSGLPFSAYPNDAAENDSANAYLATGLMLTVHPGASYTISFNADSNYDSPKLQLYRLKFPTDSTYTYRQIRNISAKEVDGKWVYTFDCSEDDRAYWATTLLGEDGSYYKGKVSGFSFKGVGAYDSHLSLNLIVVGSYGGTSDSVSLDSLSKMILEGFRSALSGGGIIVDTLYLHHASERTDLATSYPDNKQWQAGKSSDDMFLTELGGWPDSLGEKGIYYALDLILVHRIESAGVLGYSILFGGSLGGGTGSTVVIGTQYYTVSPLRKYPQKASEIVATTVHESGHFLGLRHTTSTMADMESSGDFSNREDGLDDTPYCSDYIPYFSSTLVKRSDVRYLPMPRLVLSKSLSSCPDASNPMFPSAVDVESTGFSVEQIALAKATLELYKH